MSEQAVATWISFVVTLGAIALTMVVHARRVALNAIPESVDLAPAARLTGLRWVDADIVWNSLGFVFVVTTGNAVYDVVATLAGGALVSRLK